ncbi:cytotoxic and regulatory T-cell molecule [Lacerta agilis]|uniref:cytotoxic and regulatory T-cell molecule n=1 Tax=Lacerta agilis TaxID=80427 RepID=UPI0014197230|nr:cytotoxic and regulatory T-cell molecule [Lacerta agilis]
MPLVPALFELALLLQLLQGSFQEAPIENVTVVEGGKLDLRCPVAGDIGSAVEWKNPCGFVIFFRNTQRGIRDPRYTLVQHSAAEFSVRLSNVMVHDEGVYTCLRYTTPTRRKQVIVNVLAAPSRPLLEASRVRVHNPEEKMVLRCSTWGAKPPPQITWLLDNGMELFGDAKHQLEGKKWNSTSTLTVHTYTQKSAVTCVIRHKALGGGNLTANLHLGHNEPTTDFTPTTLPVSTITPENLPHYKGPGKALNITEGSPGTQTPHTSAAAATLNSNATNGSEKILNVTEENLSIPTLSPTGGAATLNSYPTKGSDTIFNVTEGNSSTQTPYPGSDTATMNSQGTIATNLTHEGIVKRASLLLPILVTVLLSALFIVVLLFVVKLWKAHREWKKENEVSDQTLESNKSRPNEDNHLEKNRNVIPWKISKKYVIGGSCTRTTKNSEGSQDSSVFEKHSPSVKETDL